MLKENKPPVIFRLKESKEDIHEAKSGCDLKINIQGATKSSWKLLMVKTKTFTKKVRC